MGKNVASSIVVRALLLATAVAAVVNIASAGGNLRASIMALDSVDALCGYTSYVDSCKRTLASITSPTNTTDVIRTSSYAALEELNSLIGRSDEIAKALTEPYKQRAMESCKGFLDHAIDDLRAVIIEAPNLPTMSFDLRNWMSGVMASAFICIAELDVAPDLQSQMQNFMGNATELMSNTLSLITGLAEVVDVMGVGRKLGECPTWMPEHDRELLASDNNAGDRWPNLTVASDGSGDVRTIMEAISMVPKKSAKRFSIHVKAGTYREKVTVPKTAQNVFMYGDGRTKTKVTGSVCGKAPENISTSLTATFSVEGNGFVCKRMGFENTAGPEGHQAVALRVHAYKTAFYNCRMDGYQDTLYAQKGSQFYSNCIITGTIDFIFGMSKALLQNCDIIVRKPLPGQSNTITADGRSVKNMTTGIVLHGCRIVPDDALFRVRKHVQTYLGRPWRPEALTVVMESTIGDLIWPDGWLRWNTTQDVARTYYAEYNNVGPGAATGRRVDWVHRTMSTDDAMLCTVEKFLEGSKWVIATRAKVAPGLMN